MVIFEPIMWRFMNQWMSVVKLSDKVAYSLTCYNKHELTDEHTIDCLWIWHDCDMSVAVDPATVKDMSKVELVQGWKPTGVAKHELLSIEPLHLEPSVYWPACCGMHGFIRDGKWEDV